MMQCNIEAVDTKVKGPDKPFLVQARRAGVRLPGGGIARHRARLALFRGPGHGAFPAGRPLVGPLHRIDPRT